jgi:hypothetical protein
MPSRYRKASATRHSDDDTIKQAFAAGTRTRPARTGQQLWTDYKINARLDSAIVVSAANLTFHHNSDSAMRSIVLRLDRHLQARGTSRQRMDALTVGMRIAARRQRSNLAGERHGRQSDSRHDAQTPPRPHEADFGAHSLSAPIATHSAGQSKMEL